MFREKYDLDKNASIRLAVIAAHGSFITND